MTVKRKDNTPGKKALTTRDIPGRIIAAREALGLNKKTFAASLGKSASYISIIEHGKRVPAVDFFIALSNIHNVNLEYLLHGTGDMFKTEEKIDRREIIYDIENTDDVIWLMENSPIARNAVYAFAAKYFYDNEELLKKNIKRFREKNKSKD
jgi:transcriptional regulator with XRE-family HTH domain